MKKMFLIIKETKRAAIISFLVIVVTVVVIVFGINTVTDFSDLSKTVQKEDSKKYAEQKELFDQADQEKHQKNLMLTNIKNLPLRSEVKLKVESIPQNFDIVAEYFRVLSQKNPDNNVFEKVFEASQEIADSAYRISETFDSDNLHIEETHFNIDEIAMTDRIAFEIARINQHNQTLKMLLPRLEDPELIKIIEAENILSEEFISLTKKQQIVLDLVDWDEKELIKAIGTVNQLIHDFIETTDKTVTVMESSNQDYSNDRAEDVAGSSNGLAPNNKTKKNVSAPQNDSE